MNIITEDLSAIFIQLKLGLEHTLLKEPYSKQEISRLLQEQSDWNKVGCQASLGSFLSHHNYGLSLMIHHKYLILIINLKVIQY